MNILADRLLLRRRYFGWNSTAGARRLFRDRMTLKRVAGVTKREAITCQRRWRWLYASSALKPT
jgi:hypothetical protein